MLGRLKSFVYNFAVTKGATGVVVAVTCSVTRLSYLFHFGQLFKACNNNSLPKLPTFLDNFCKVVKIFHFASESIFGQLL